MDTSTVSFDRALQCFRCSRCGEEIEIPKWVLVAPEMFAIMHESLGRLHSECEMPCREVDASMLDFIAAIRQHLGVNIGADYGTGSTQAIQ